MRSTSAHRGASILTAGTQGDRGKDIFIMNFKQDGQHQSQVKYKAVL
jgi:hypothetical protein